MRGRTSSALGDCVWSNNPPPGLTSVSSLTFHGLPLPSWSSKPTSFPRSNLFCSPLDFVLHGVGEGKGQEK